MIITKTVELAIGNGAIGENDFRYHVGPRGELDMIEIELHGRNGRYWHELPKRYSVADAFEHAIYDQAADYYCRVVRSDVLRSLIKSRPVAVVGELNRMGA